MRVFNKLFIAFSLLSISLTYTLSVNAFEDNFSEFNSLSNYTINANDGAVVIESGALSLSAPLGARGYPYVALKSDIITLPVSEVEVRFKYQTVGAFGGGIIFDDNYPINGLYYDVGHNSILWTWNWEGTWKVGYYPFTYSEIGNPSDFHVLRITGVPGNYSVFLDGSLHATVASTKPITSIWFGNPHVVSSPDTWPTIIIDQIKVVDSSIPPDIVPVFPYYSQKDTAWGGTEYDNATQWAGEEEKGIARWGCALTSVAMILKNYDVKSPIDGSETNPSVLNTWLKGQSDGYIRGGLLNWLAVARYAKLAQAAGHSPTAAEFTRQQYDSQYVDGQLATGTPVILGETGHYTVVYKDNTDTYSMADPNNESRSTEQKTYSFLTANTFTKSNTDLSYFLFAKDPGLQANLKNGSGEDIPLLFITEFPSDSLQTAYLPKMPAGKYKLTLTGNTDNTSSIDIYLYGIDGEPNYHKLDVPSNTTIVYQIDYKPSEIQNSTINKLDTTPPPVPTLTYPADHATVKRNGLVLNWDDVSDDESNPVAYWYQSFWSTSGHYGPRSTTSVSHIDASGSSDNTYRWQVKACDAVGNCSDWSALREVTIDGTLPTAPTIMSPAEDQYFRTAPIKNEWTASADKSGISQYRVEYEYDDHHTFPDFPYRLTTDTWRNHSPAITEQGGVRFRVQAIDKVGNESAWSEWRHYFYDVTAPTAPSLPFTTPNPTNSSTQNWSWGSSTDNQIVSGYYSRFYDVLGETYKEWFWLGNTLSTTSHLTEGQWLLQVKAEDVAGNQSSATSSAIVTVDTTPPTTPVMNGFLNPDLPCDSYTNSRYVTIDWSDSIDTSNISKYEYNIDYPLASGTGRSNWTTYFTSSQYRGSLNKGLHKIKVSAYDYAGNSSSWSNTCSITYDPDPPISTITHPANTESGMTIVTNNWNGLVAGTATDSASTIAWTELSIRRSSDNKYWNGVDWVTGSESLTRVAAVGTTNWTYTLPSTLEDTYTIISHAVDIAGNKESSYRLEIVLDRTTPISPRITDVHIESDGKSATVYWEGAHDATGIAKYEVQWWKDTAYKFTNTVGSEIRKNLITDLSDGTWTVIVRAFDRAGNTAEASSSFTLGPIAGQVLGDSTENIVIPIRLPKILAQIPEEENDNETVDDTGSVLGESMASTAANLASPTDNTIDSATPKSKVWISILIAVVTLFVIWYLLRRINR